MANNNTGVIKKFLSGVGRAGILTYNIIYWSFRRPLYIKNIIYQMNEIGVKSVWVTSLTALFTGMVLALQTGLIGQNWFGEPVYVGMTVGFSLVKELGPVLTAVVIAGRVGAAITAELGTMKVTEQIDALYTLGVNPVKYLAVPRFLACMVMVPFLTSFANFIGILGGLFVSVTVLNVSSYTYIHNITDYMMMNDVMHGLIKSGFYGVIIAIVSTYKGFSTEEGAEGVGRATTSTVVTSMVLILVSDYFLTTILVGMGIGSGGR